MQDIPAVQVQLPMTPVPQPSQLSQAAGDGHLAEQNFSSDGWPDKAALSDQQRAAARQVVFSNHADSGQLGSTLPLDSREASEAQGAAESVSTAAVRSRHAAGFGAAIVQVLPQQVVRRPGELPLEMQLPNPLGRSMAENELPKAEQDLGLNDTQQVLTT